jgi:uncharacterized protein (TIGR03790 family)
VVYVAVLFAMFCSPRVHAGGSGLNTIVVVNQSSSNSVEVGNYYCERRQVPPDNVLRIAWSGPNISWTNTDFETVLLNPLLTAITNRHLDAQAYYVVLSMDIPFQTVFDGIVNSTTSALFYGPKTENGPDWVSITNSFFAGELPFDLNRPASARQRSFLASMVTAPSVAQAKQLIDRGVAADGLRPGQPVLLEKSSDPLRNFRYWTFDNAIFNAQICNTFQVTRTNSDSPWGHTNLLGFQTGLSQLSVAPNTFVPGAMADSLTSYGGIIFGPNDQTTLMTFIAAGACGSYGTVTEPSPMLEKFPISQNYFYQRRGFSIAECYYQSIFEPYQGLVVGEPLSAPFRRNARGRWSNLKTNASVAGVQPVLVQWAAADDQHPIQQVDLFVDGKFFRTITNVSPISGETLTATLNGYPVTCAVPPNAAIGAIAAGLASAINSAAIPGGQKISALSYGDRIELQASTNFAGPFFFVDHAGSTVPRFYRTVLLPVSSQPLLSPSGLDPSGAFKLHIEPPDTRSYSIEASTNLLDWVPLAEDLTGALDFSDPDAVLLPARFYRFGAPQSAPPPPQLTALGWTPAGSFRLHVQNAGTAGCRIEASTDLVHWAPLATSLSGSFDFADVAARQFAARFYRAVNLPAAAIRPRAGIIGQTPSGDSLVMIDAASAPYALQVSTDLVHWTTLFTNAAPSRFQLAVSHSTAAAPLGMGIYAARKTLMNSPAQGIRRVKIYGTLNIDGFAQLSFTKTNGVLVTVGVTNHSPTASVFDLTQSLVAAINSCPDLQGSDGLAASDLSPGWYGSASFNLHARSAGIEAAALTFAFSGSAGLLVSPNSSAALDQNLPDLRPRDHIYLTCGATNLTVRFPLDTRQLSDGWHQLDCVAYEGSSVRTQSRINLSIVVTNSPLSAAFSVTDLASANSPIASRSSTYQARVVAHSTNISSIRLFGTGGALATATGRSDVAFPIDAAFFGPGLHRFYAIVESTGGSSYRTEPVDFRFGGY